MFSHITIYCSVIQDQDLSKIMQFYHITMSLSGVFSKCEFRDARFDWFK